MVHIQDIESPLRARQQAHGPEALIGRGEELRLRVIRGGAHPRARRGQHVALDQVARGLAHKGIAIGIGGEEVGPVDPRGTGGRELLEFMILQYLRSVTTIDTG